MKTFNSHLFALKTLQKFPRFPNNSRVVLFGAPNVGTSLFAHRLAIDIGVPAISMRDIYRNIITNEDYYRTEKFYRKVIDLLKALNQSSPEQASQISKELESNMIPEKLLTLTKYSEMGFVLYDYPNTIKQCEK
jgi:adenylate kinase family enzyme